MAFARKKRIILAAIALLFCAALAGCGKSGEISDGAVYTAAGTQQIGDSDKVERIPYEQINQAEAKKIMESGVEIIILDVRTEEEYATGHIPGALLIPYDELPSRAPAELPDRSASILVYCRSGRRSKIAAQSLSDLGYTSVKEFGGIISWEYETVK